MYVCLRLRNKTLANTRILDYNVMTKLFENYWSLRFLCGYFGSRTFYLGVAMMRRTISVFFAIALMLSIVPSIFYDVATNAATIDTEGNLVSEDISIPNERNVNVATVVNSNSNDIEKLIAKLPIVSAPLGTEYYFYDQLSDIEKVMYWKISEASWENPTILIGGLTEYTQEELYRYSNRALTALQADKPRYRLLWKRWATESISFDGETFVFMPKAETESSEYLIQKSEARIRQLVETVGTEGDLYSRTRELLDLMHINMEYDPYLPFGSNRKGFFNDSVIGCLVYDTAVCAGFADTVKILCDELEIPCIRVGNAGHAWNFIRMDDGKWYSVDASADADFQYYSLIGSESSQYMGSSNYQISELYHAEPGDFVFPSLSKNEYVYSGTYTETYHDAQMHFDEPNPRFTYRINADGASCTILAYEGIQSGDLSIPEEIDGYTVTEIGDGAFYRSVGFTGKVIIPDTVKVIETAAFQACTGLNGTLILPSNLNRIGEYAFLGMKSLTGSLDFPNSLTVIGRCAFYDCEGLTGDIVLPEGITLGDEIFANCKNLTGTLYLPDSMMWGGNITSGSSVSKIHVNETNANYSTYNGMLFSKDMKTLLVCPSGKIGDMVIPDGVETIARCAVYRCKNLNGHLQLPETLKTIEEFAFSGTPLTGDLIIPNSVESIGENAFSGAFNGGKLVLSSGMTRIEYSTFFGCGFSGDLIIPDSITRIEDWAFVGATFDGQIQMSKAIEYIGNNAINGNFCNSLELKDTDVILEEDACNAYFKFFSCNCDSEYLVDTFIHTMIYKCGHCHGRYTEVSDHRWDEGVVSIEPTEETVGLRCYTCVVCLETKTEAIPVLEHSHRYTAVTTSSTCQERGYTTHTCVCGDSYIDSYVDALDHDMGQWYTTQEPTCTQIGEQRRNCSRCDHYEIEEISATGHTHTAKVTKPSCTELGYTTHTCACGDNYVDSYVDALGHSFTSYKSNNNATCTADGTETAKCDRCDETNTHTVVGSALGHNIGIWYVTKEPSCTENGTQRKDCSRCDYYETEEIAANGHSYIAVITVPNCVNQGYTTHTCACGDNYVDSYVNALGHSFTSYKSNNNATCTADGTETAKCDRCAVTDTRTEAGSTKGHSYTVVVTAPTCTQQGYTTHTCHCGDSYVDSYVVANGHSYVVTVVKPTPTAQGYTQYTCHCGDYYRTDYVAALDMSVPKVSITVDAATGKPVLSWKNAGEGVTYEIYCATSKSGKYTKVATVSEPNWIDTAVSVGKTYYYKVKAVYAEDTSVNSDYSTVVSATAKCATPNISVKNNSSGKPYITWEKTSGAKKYTVYRATSETGKYKSLGTTTKTYYTDSKAAAGNTYYYKVIANASSSKYNSGYSNIVSCGVICGTPSVTVKIDTNAGKPSLSWKKVDGAASYAIFRDGEPLTTVTGVSYADTTAAIDTQYSYQVQALGKTEALNGVVSKAVSATSGIAKPAVKGSVDAVSGKSVLIWDAVEGAVKYEVYRSTKSSKSYKLVATVEELTYTDETVSAGKTYCYKVKAIGAISKSADSSYVKLTGKCATPQISVNNDAKGKPYISWEKVGGAKKYTVYRATSETGKYTKLGTTTKAFYTDSKASAGKTYFYKIVANASSSKNNSPYSNIVSCGVNCATPVVKVTNNASGKPVLSWSKVSGAVKYEIYLLGAEDYVVLGTVTATTWTDAGCAIGEGRYYGVRAVAAEESYNSEVSQPVFVRATCATPKATGKVGENKKPVITWAEVDGATKYVVYRSTSKSKGYKIIGESETLTYEDLTAAKGKTYYYKVVAVGENCESAQSSFAKVKSK